MYVRFAARPEEALSTSTDCQCAGDARPWCIRWSTGGPGDQPRGAPRCSGLAPAVAPLKRSHRHVRPRCAMSPARFRAPLSAARAPGDTRTVHGRSSHREDHPGCPPFRPSSRADQESSAADSGEGSTRSCGAVSMCSAICSKICGT